MTRNKEKDVMKGISSSRRLCSMALLIPVNMIVPLVDCAILVRGMCDAFEILSSVDV